MDQKLETLKELEHKAQNPELWKNPKEMEKVNRDKAIIERTCEQWTELNSKIEDVSVLLDMAEEEKDEDSFMEAVDEVQSLRSVVDELELKKLLDGETDANSAFLSINSGAGGTEACDWAGMLYRMYTR
ncbi:MAG: PCRF domain-containing protein, partial [Bdellovibrionales bacterium]|nr:PCRF domain-containing protein [Bdellovibrionales bacterium]